MSGSSGTATGDPVVGTRAALVVAAHEFEDPRFQRLRSPAQDVDALAEVLGDPGIGGFTVQSVVNQPNGVVQRELERFFSTRKPDDLLLVYFSCHGVKDSTGRLYFATTNTAFDLLRSTGVPASFVSEQMELTRSKRIVVLLDCCYSGAFLQGFRARGDDSVSVSQLEGRGRAVITASRSTEYAFEADQLTSANAQPSVFTGAVVEGLATGAADRNGDGIVTVDELYDFVYDNVRGKVAGQTPGRWVNLEGELAVARNPRPPVRAAALPSEVARALESDVALQRLGAVWQLGEWLQRGRPGEQMTARDVLDRLSRDYDERVRNAATSVLAGAPRVEPAAVATPAPKPAPAPIATPRPEPAVASAATSDAPPADRRLRRIGWLALAAVVASIVAGFVPFAIEDGTSFRLIESGWYQIWVLGVGGLAVCAAFALLGQGLARGPGIALVLGVAPAAVASGFGLSAHLASATKYYGSAFGPGYVLALAGRIALAAAAVLAATRARDHLPLTPPPTARAATVTATAAVIGVGAALGLGRLAVVGYPQGDSLDVPVSLLWKFALWSLLLTTIGCVLSGWLGDHGIRGRRRVVGTVVLYALVVWLFLAAADPYSGLDAWILAWYASLVVGATVLPVVATLVLSRRLGAMLLVAWTVGMFAEGGPGIWDSDDTAGRVVLSLSLVAAIALAARLWSSSLAGDGSQHVEAGSPAGR
jgi:Caspase domain